MNNRFLCDLFGLVDLDTENVSFPEKKLSKKELQRCNFDEFKVSLNIGMVNLDESIGFTPKLKCFERIGHVNRMCAPFFFWPLASCFGTSRCLGQSQNEKRKYGRKQQVKCL